MSDYKSQAISFAHKVDNCNNQIQDGLKRITKIYDELDFDVENIDDALSFYTNQYVKDMENNLMMCESDNDRIASLIIEKAKKLDYEEEQAKIDETVNE